MDNQDEDFKAAVELIGLDWLEDKEKEYYHDKEKLDHLHGESPPRSVQLYYVAKEDIRGEREGPLEYPDLREDTVRFLRIGQTYRNVKDSAVITPAGEIIEGKSVADLYRDLLHSDDHFQSALFELETGAFYVQLGHNPAYVDETLTTSKSPDIELLDLNKRVQIECKRCSAKSDQDEMLSNRLNDLFHKIKRILDFPCIALIELSRVPEGSEVAEFGTEIPNWIFDFRELPQEVTLPFGSLHLLPFYKQGIIEQPISGLEGSEVLLDFYELYVRPVLAGRLEIDKPANELGDWQLHSEFRSTMTTGFHKDTFWVGVSDNKWSSDSIDRVKNQFKGVSRKFYGCPSVLHIFFPDLREGDALIDLRLRRLAGGELKERPEVSGAVISGLDIKYSENGVQVDIPTIFIPNYSPQHQLPESFNLVQTDLGQAISHDEVRSSANEKLMADPQGFEKALDQDEGTISFRFTPKESSDVTSAKSIISVDSISGDVSVELNVIPGPAFRLTRIMENVEWNCEIDGKSIPDFTPLYFFIIWDETQTKLVISQEDSGEQLVSVCDDPTK